MFHMLALYVSCYELPTYGKSSFAYAGPTTWNSLPEHLRIRSNSHPALNSFMCPSKTHFYVQMTHWALRLLVIVSYINWAGEKYSGPTDFLWKWSFDAVGKLFCALNHPSRLSSTTVTEHNWESVDLNPAGPLRKAVSSITHNSPAWSTVLLARQVVF